MDNNMTVWIECGPDEFKPGMMIKTVEKFASGAVITFEGEVERIYFGPDGARRVDLVGVPPVERTAPPEGWSVEMYRQPRELPMAEGSAIKVYDPNYLRDRVAIRKRVSYSDFPVVLSWVFADDIDERSIPDHLLESATVLFDASKA